MNMTSRSERYVISIPPSFPIPRITNGSVSKKSKSPNFRPISFKAISTAACRQTSAKFGDKLSSYGDSMSPERCLTPIMSISSFLNILNTSSSDSRSEQYAEPLGQFCFQGLLLFWIMLRSSGYERIDRLGVANQEIGEESAFSAGSSL